MNGFHSIFIRYVHGYIFLMGKLLLLSEIGGSSMEKVFCMFFLIKAFPKLFILCGDLDNGSAYTVY